MKPKKKVDAIVEEPATKKDTMESLKREIEIDKITRSTACGNVIQKALNDHQCEMIISMLVTVQGNVPQVQIVAKVTE